MFQARPHKPGSIRFDSGARYQFEVTMSEKKESLWLVSRAGKDGRIFRSRASARLFKSRKPVPADYAVEPVKWGPERQKAR